MWTFKTGNLDYRHSLDSALPYELRWTWSPRQAVRQQPLSFSPASAKTILTWMRRKTCPHKISHLLSYTTSFFFSWKHKASYTMHWEGLSVILLTCTLWKCRLYNFNERYILSRQFKTDMNNEYPGIFKYLQCWKWEHNSHYSRHTKLRSLETLKLNHNCCSE